MALAWTLLGLCLALESWYQISAAKKGPSDGEAPRSAEPLRYFDLWRCICVACVVVTHIWEGYHAENILGCGQWVLQFLMLISGTCFAKSSSSLMRYCWRLLLVWSVGTLLNWMVMVAVEAKWRDSSWRVQFQMGFCLQILVMALATAPLKLFKPDKLWGLQTLECLRHSWEVALHFDGWEAEPGRFLQIRAGGPGALCIGHALRAGCDARLSQAVGCQLAHREAWDGDS